MTQRGVTAGIIHVTIATAAGTAAAWLNPRQWIPSEDQNGKQFLWAANRRSVGWELHLHSSPPPKTDARSAPGETPSPATLSSATTGISRLDRIAQRGGEGAPPRNRFLLWLSRDEDARWMDPKQSARTGLSRKGGRQGIGENKKAGPQGQTGLGQQPELRPISQPALSSWPPCGPPVSWQGVLSQHAAK